MWVVVLLSSGYSLLTGRLTELKSELDYKPSEDMALNWMLVHPPSPDY